MYSVILLAAMTTPAETPGWGLRFHRGCNGCNGCAGYACGGCAGTPRVGCVGSAPYSCVGSHPAVAYAPAPVVATTGYTCGGCCGGHMFGHGGCWGTGGFRTWGSCHGAGSGWGHAYAGGS